MFIFELKGEVPVPRGERLYTFKLYCAARRLEDAIVMITRDIRRVVGANAVPLYRGTRLITYRAGSDIRIVRR